MILEPTSFEGLCLVKPRVLGDDRGFFMEAFNKRDFIKAGFDIDFVQDNHSYSRKDVVRGLHYQNKPHQQTKLVRVISGEILDIVLDLRENQPTFGKVFSGLLSAENKVQLLIPKGFAHGFVVMSEVAEVLYKCDEYYHPESEGGINFFDVSLGLSELLPRTDYIVSDKDRSLPNLDSAKFLF